MAESPALAGGLPLIEIAKLNSINPAAPMRSRIGDHAARWFGKLWPWNWRSAPARLVE
jgi:hypothetical protein